MFDLGDTLPFSARLYDKPPEQGGVLVNALTVALTITLPNGAGVVPTVAAPAQVGVYTYDYVTTTVAGHYVGRWLFTMAGGNTAAHVEAFDVRATPAVPGWPPLLQDVKDEIEIDDSRDDVRIQRALDAAVAFVQRERAGELAFGDPFSTLPEPDADVVLGTLRLAGRFYARRRSPDGLSDLGELGSARIPGSDPDIERLLKIGRFRAPMVG